MKRSELFFTALLIPFDLLMILLAFIAAYYLRLHIGQINFVWPFDQYFGFISVIAPVWLPIFAIAGLYSIQKTWRPWQEFGSVVVGVAGGTMLVIAWPFLTRQEFFSRLVVIYLFFAALIFVTLGRVLLRSLRQWLFSFGFGVHRVLIVGTNGGTAEFVREITQNKGLGLRLIGLIRSRPDAQVNPELAGVPILGTVDDLRQLIDKDMIDDLLLADSELPRKKVLELLELAEDHRLSFKISPNLLQVHTTNIGITELAGVPILEYQQTPLDGWGRILKRTVDIIGSLLGIIFFSPFMLLTALAVKLTSDGPIIYKNERVGDNGRFFAYKFRSMRQEYCTGPGFSDKALKFEEELIKKQNTRSGPIYKIGNDPRLTPIGAFIRKTSLDELPQFFNVLWGEMSLVGPRPHQPREVDHYGREHRKLLHIKPGITGMAQVSGRSDLDFEDEFRLDTYYIENWSLSLDVEILVKTPLAVLSSRHRKAA